MQTYLKNVLLFTCLIFGGCSFIKPDIEEISHTIGGVNSRGDRHFYEISFKKGGTAEETTKKYVHDVTITEQSHKRGKFSKEQFEKLTNVINQTGFFSKQNRGMPYDASDTIKVIYSKGVKEIQLLDRDDPDIKTILDAIDQIDTQTQWEKVD